MSVYSGFPEFNNLQAKRFIKENYKTEITGFSICGTITEKHIGMIVDIFMQKYPRGKGTTGNELLRKFYEACYNIKKSKSHPRRFRNYAKLARVLDRAKEHLKQKDSPIFRFDEFGENLTGPKRGLTKMIDAGEVSGYVGEPWLTDFGIMLRTNAVQLKAQQIKKDRASALNKFGPEMVEYHSQRLSNCDPSEKALHEFAIAHFSD